MKLANRTGLPCEIVQHRLWRFYQPVEQDFPAFEINGANTSQLLAMFRKALRGGYISELKMAVQKEAYHFAIYSDYLDGT